MRTDANLPPIDDALKPRSHGLAHILGDLQLETLAGHGRDDGGCDDMMRGLLQRGCEPKQFIRILARSSLDGDQARSANCQSARLVEHYCVRAGERLERATA